MSTQTTPATMKSERFKLLANTILKTHHAHGGSTYKLDGHNMIGTHGYAVSIYPELEQTISDHELTSGLIRRYINRNYATLHKSISAIGTWASDGLAYLDTVVVVKSKRDAIALGSKAHQQAIFDLHNLETITLAEEHKA